MKAITAVALLFSLCAFQSWGAAPTETRYANDVAALSDPLPSQEASAAEARLIADGAAAVPALLRGLDNPGQATRARCLDAILKIGQASEEDIALLGRKERADPDAAVRLNSLSIFKRVRSAGAVKELKLFAEKDPSATVREYSIYYLGVISGRQDESFLRSRLQDKSLTVRLATYVALARLGDRSGRDLAISILQGKAKQTERLAAIRVLGFSGDARDAEVLNQISNSQSEDGTTRYEAERARHHIDLLQLPESQRLAKLAKSVADPSWAVRNWASSELSERDDPEAIDALRKIVANPNAIGSKEASAALNDHARH